MNFDIYNLVTNRIIEQLEKGIIPWHKPWKVQKIDGEIDYTKVAFNRVSKQVYSPLNQMLLSKTGEYASFKQWKELGGKIKKGAKAEIVVFWKILDAVTENENEENEIKKIPYLRYLQVFHIDDVENVKPLELKPTKTKELFENIEDAENIINEYLKREDINILFGGNRAFYSPVKDYIQVPNKYQFGTHKAEYYSTIFHEMTHSTGHKSRLDRLTSNAFFGNEEYSKEELVAEIGASGMLNLLNIETPTSFENSVAYIQGWLDALKNDKKLIVSASTKAEKAIYYILNGKETI